MPKNATKKRKILTLLTFPTKRYPPNLPTLRLPTWLQSESRQYDNKNIYPDCRYRLILLQFTGCGWHFYIIINFILEGCTIVLSMTEGPWSLRFLGRNETTFLIFILIFFRFCKTYKFFLSMFFDVTFCLESASTNMTFTTSLYEYSYGKDI